MNVTFYSKLTTSPLLERGKHSRPSDIPTGDLG
jgi:hypothetical protein